MPDIATLRFAGPSLTLLHSDNIKESINQHLRAGQLWIVLDFSDIEFIDSTAIGALIAAVRRVQSFQGRVGLCGVSSEIARILALMNLDKLLPRYASLEEARRIVGGEAG